MANNANEPIALPEEIRALCGMLDIYVRQISGYPGHTWEMNLFYSIDGVRHRLERRIQTVEYDAWLQNARELHELAENRKSAG